MELRCLGRSGIKTSPLGLGTARIAGLHWREELAPRVSAEAFQEAVLQIRTAIDGGITFFDTANNYGQGLSERILGEALRGRREDIVIATKFGEDPVPGQEDPWDLSAAAVEAACEASLGRLEVECIDLYLLHRRDYPLEKAANLMEVLENLVQAGKIRYYGWSTDDVARARLFAGGKHCTAIEHRLNVFNDNPEMLELCRQENLASLNRVPLLMGVLTGRWSPDTRLEADDRRADWFKDEKFLELLAQAKQLEPYLTGNGRSYVQGALGWIWARSPVAVPLPGFRSMAQLQELIQARQYGPLSAEAMQSIHETLNTLRAGQQS